MTRPAARAFVAYNLWRLALLALCFGLGALAGLRGLLLVVAALLVSGVLSWFLLARQRLALAVVASDAVERGRRRFADRTAREDAYADALHAAPAASDEVGVTRSDR